MRFSGVTLVTGAAGFVGRHLVQRLVLRGVEVRATDRPGGALKALADSGAQVVAADLTHPGELPPLFDDVDRVFHLGAICNLSTPFTRLYPVNVQAVDTVTNLAKTQGVRCFVHTSSTAVYGLYRGTPFTEQDPHLPCDSYGRSKAAGEEMVRRRMAEGLPAVIARPSTIYGPGCNDGAGKVFSRPSAISAIPGHGRQRLANVRVEDVAAALDYLSEREEAVGEAFNISDDSQPTLEQALRAAAEVFGNDPPTLHVPLWIVKVAARASGWAAARKGQLPDLEYDAVRFLYADYVVDNRKLKQTGFCFTYGDFFASLRQLKSLQ
jgi:nucleoside-diphosphate-sugar epimerase